MNSQQFDNHIKEQFSQYAPAVDPRLWEQIAARTKKKKPVGFWYSLLHNRGRLTLIALLLLTGTGAGSWWYYNNSSRTGNKLQQVSANTQPGSSGGPLQQPTAGNGETNTAPAEPIPAKQQIQPEDNNKRKVLPGSTDSNNPSLATLQTGSRQKININPPNLQEDVSGESSMTPAKRTAHGNAAKKTRKTRDQLRLTTESPTVGEMEEEETPLVGGTLLNRLQFEAEKVSAKRKPTLLTPVLKPTNIDPGCPTFEKDAAGNKKYLEIYAGPDYAFRSLTDTANSEYLRRRKESTKFSSAFSAGIRYTRVFSNSMSVRAGFNYSQINEKFKFKQGNIVQVVYIINASGDTIGSYTVTGTRYKTTINNYRSIDIPIAMGYEVGNGRWHANINAGVVINIYSWQKGEILDASYNPVSITTGKNSSPYQFKTNAGIGFMGGVSVYYKLNERYHLFAEPYFRYNFSPMNKDNITLKQKYQTAGLRLGVRLDLK
ncbi:MAG: hypothetical protein U0T79_13465 [Ferruginibacter sp.]